MIEKVRVPAAARGLYSAGFVIACLGLALYVLSTAADGFATPESIFAARRPLVLQFTRLRLWLGDRVFTQVLVGNDGWLEYTPVIPHNSLQNQPVLAPGEIENIQQNLAVMAELLRQRNITLVVAIAPDKGTVYPDRLPAGLPRLQPQSELDLLVAYLEEHGPPVLLDLRPALLAARRQQDVYYRTDSHWNGYGELAAYQAIMERVAQTYPAAAPRPLDTFTVVEIAPLTHDLARIMGADWLLEPGKLVVANNPELTWISYNHDLPPTQVAYQARADLPAMVMYMDSFGEALMPLLAPHFREALFIHHFTHITDLMTFKPVGAAQPDVVILELVERSLPQLNPLLLRYLNNGL